MRLMKLGGRRIRDDCIRGNVTGHDRMRPDYCAVANGDPGGDIRPVPDPYIISNYSDFYLGGRLAVSCPIIVVVFGCLKTVAKFEYSVPKIESGTCGYPVQRVVLPTYLNGFAE
jgi:hypothetical protein